MNEKDVEELLTRYKQQELAVDEAFKKRLRKSFEQKKKRPYWFRQFSLLGMVASLLVVIYAYFDAGVSHVAASSLKIWDQQPLAQVSSGEITSLAERNDTLYLSLKEKGIFAYTEHSFSKVVEEKADSFQWNPSGHVVLFASDGTIGTYDTRSAIKQIVRQGEQGNAVYSNPSWAGENVILYDKREGNQLESQIVRLDLSTMKETTLGSGRKPSYVPDAEAVLFERDGKIILKDLHGQQERIIDAGFDPAVSSDGGYIAYVKAEQSIENVWISDVRKGTKKKISSNLENANPEVQLEIGEAVYHFSHPVWSADSSQVYVLKHRKGGGGTQLTRIDLTKTSLTAKETVTRYLRALMSREEDFAKSLLVHPPAEYVTFSNPRVTGYRVFGEGTDNGRPYVDAEAYWSYTANPYYQIVSSRYYLTPGENGYAISDIVENGSTEVIARDDEEQVKLLADGTETILFGKKEIPAELLEPTGKFRIASLAYDKPTQQLYVTLQYMREENSASSSSVTLLRYDVAAKKFSLLDQIREVDGKKGVGVSNVTVDPSGPFVSVDLYQDSPDASTALTYVYNLQTMKKVDLRETISTTESTHTYAQYWDSGRATFQAESNGLLLQFDYAPKK